MSAGIQENGNGQQFIPEDEGTEQRRAARKRKPKVLYEVQLAWPFLCERKSVAVANLDPTSNQRMLIRKYNCICFCERVGRLSTIGRNF